MIMFTRSNRRPDRDASAITAATWPTSRVGEALSTLAWRAGLPVHVRANEPVPTSLCDEELGHWIDAAAARAGVEAIQLTELLHEVVDVVCHNAPVLVRVGDGDDAAFLAVLRGTRRVISAVGPDGQLHRIPTSAVAAAMEDPYEAPLRAEIDAMLDGMRLVGRARWRARGALLRTRLGTTRVRDTWVLRLLPGATVRHHLRDLRVTRRAAVLIVAYAAQSLLLVASWWVLGQGVLDGTLDRGWVCGWLLLLLSLVPLRLLVTWMQGTVALASGIAVRRRLLRGALRMDRQAIRQQGPGDLFGVSLEAASIEALASSGGVVALLATFDLVLASAVLWAGGAAGPLLLVMWLVLLAVLTARYVCRRRAWTRERFTMTAQLLANMVGHRTRVAQIVDHDQHRAEDESLERYLRQSQAMDQSSLWLAAAPRGWLVVAIVAMIPMVVRGASPSQMALSVGGLLLAHRALQRVSGGLSSLAGAAIAVSSIAPLAQAATEEETPSAPTMVLAGNRRPAESADPIVAQATDVTFRYRQGGEAILRGCSLRIARGVRFLLKGPSGSGKTTFASILAGLHAPDSGLLLVDGLDRSVLGAAGWRSRVVMAPQAHDNYLVAGSLAFNLLMGRRWPAEATDLADAEAVCQELGLGELLRRLPSGLHQIVGETGWQLSQGERIRVFLARALLQRPELLVLDESFSALDPENVDRSLRCVVNRAPTVFAIAHT